MKHLINILFFFILMISDNAFACDCYSQKSFLEVVPKSDFVALVKVEKYLSFKDIYNKKTAMSMEVEIIDIYKGNEKRKKVIVWGDIGYLCRPYLSLFEEGKYYVIAFEKGSEGSGKFGHKDEKITDYAISICGEYWLKADLKKQKALGFINKNKIRLKDLKDKIK
ncbi:hypothetical protein [Paenimyroides aestuarii]|uniref:Uncharacterized protein n=1 Tax=Paenimyroides aestuarii TaxID=2968490 RepID=A0ABY5NS58_9FLAO|nr:hypothetical protein [Paenimyroides aestuarii]UUV21375.1 hypothetical protein NPX36_13755 [Paenimyroides aestuarii]